MQHFWRFVIIGGHLTENNLSSFLRNFYHKKRKKKNDIKMVIMYQNESQLSGIISESDRTLIWMEFSLFWLSPVSRDPSLQPFGLLGVGVDSQSSGPQESRGLCSLL